MWAGEQCYYVSDSAYNDSGHICGILNGNDATGDLWWQWLITFQSYSEGMKYITLIDAGVSDISAGKDISTIGYTRVSLNGNTSAFISTPWFLASPLHEYMAYAEEPCIFWQNGGIGCALDNVYSAPQSGL